MQKLKSSKVAVVLTEFVFGAFGSKDHTKKTIVPVSRIAKGDEVVGTGPQSYHTKVTLRTPEVYLNVVESVEEIATMMNGEDLGNVSILSHGANADCPQVQSGEWTHCKGHRETGQRSMRA